MTRTLRTKAAILAVVLALIAAACGGSDGDGDARAKDAGTGTTEGAGRPEAGGSFTFVMGGQVPPSWDPSVPQVGGVEANSGPAMWLEAVYGLLAYEDYSSGRVEPSLAKSIEARDASHWTLTLRPDLVFSDGTPLDAEAVKFNWERHQRTPESPENTAASTIASLEATGPTVLAITLKEPNVLFDRTVARNLPFVGSPTAMRADAQAFGEKPVGAGPFLLRSWDGTTAHYARNPKYFDHPRPYLDELTITNIFDSSQRINAIKAGQGDGIYLSNQIVAAAEDAGLAIRKVKPNGGNTLEMNQTRAPFDDVTARKALQAMLDVAGEAKTVEQGVPTAMTNLINEGDPYHDDSATIDGYDPERAQKLVDEYVEKAGGPLRFSFYVHSGTLQMATYYQARMKQFDDVDVDIHSVSPAEYVAGLASGQFDVALFPFVFSDPILPTTLLVSTTGPQNFGKYSNPKVDELLAEAARTLAVKERAEIFRKVQRHLIDDQAFIFERTRPNVEGFEDDVRGLAFAIDGVPLWDGIWLDR